MSASEPLIGVSVTDSPDRAAFGFLYSEIDHLFLELCQGLAIAGYTVVNLGGQLPGADRLRAMRHVRAAYREKGPAPFRQLVPLSVALSLPSATLRSWLEESEGAVRTFVMTLAGPVELHLSDWENGRAAYVPRTIHTAPMAFVVDNGWSSAYGTSIGHRPGFRRNVVDTLVLAGGNRSREAIMDLFPAASAGHVPSASIVDGVGVIPIPAYGGLARDIAQAADLPVRPGRRGSRTDTLYSFVVETIAAQTRNNLRVSDELSGKLSIEDRPEHLAKLVVRAVQEGRKGLVTKPDGFPGAEP